MKVLQKFALAVSLIAATAAPALAQAEPLPNSGTYFIVSALNDEALQVSQASAGQYVQPGEFNRGGLQKWVLTRKIDPSTKKPTNRYNIRLAGEAQNLNFQPHPIGSMQALISFDPSVFVLEPGESGFLVKSVARNGDALYALVSPPAYTECHFLPDDGSQKFRWKFVPANQ